MIMYKKYIMWYVMFWAKPYSKHVFFFFFPLYLFWNILTLNLKTSLTNRQLKAQNTFKNSKAHIKKAVIKPQVIGLNNR
jgi:hypothetical protein